MKKVTDMKVEIIYEDDDVLAVNKPAFLSVHKDGKADDEYTLADWVIEKYPELKDVGEPLVIKNGKQEKVVYRPGIVHRIDKETSGIVLVAKNQKSFEDLKSQFQTHEIEKVYNAFVYGWPKENRDLITTSIARSKSDIRKWSSGRGKRGREREAVTYYEVDKKIDLREKKKDVVDGGSTEEGTFSYLTLRPKTGRTHQLRVHLLHINHPIVSDTLYASKRKKSLGFERLALHARSITFSKMDKSLITVEAPYPADFTEAIKNYIGEKKA